MLGLAEKKRRLVGEGFFRMYAERWGVKDVDALLDELDPKVSLRENWDLFRKALAKRGIRPEAEALSEADEKRRYLEWLDDEVRKSGLLDELYDKIAELSGDLIERDLALSKLDEEKRRLEEERRELKITKEEYDRRAAWLKKLEEDLKKWSDELTRLQFRVPVLSGKEAGEEIERVRQVKPGLTKEQVKRLEDEFKAALFKDLGRVPRDVMAEFRVELDTVKTFPFEEARSAIERLAKDIVERELARPPIVKPPVRPPPVPAVPPPPHVEVPKEPLSPLRFPRRPAAEELKPLWEAFVYRMWELGLDPFDYRDWYADYVENAWFSSWDLVVKRFESLITDIKEGKPKFVPRAYPPWEVFPRDPVLHLLATGKYKTFDELLEALNLYAVYLEPEEVIAIVKEEWAKGPELRSSWLKVAGKDYLEKVLGVPLET